MNYNKALSGQSYRLHYLVLWLWNNAMTLSLKMTANRFVHSGS